MPTATVTWVWSSIKAVTPAVSAAPSLTTRFDVTHTEQRPAGSSTEGRSPLRRLITWLRRL